jgi:hypothetical protein
MKKILLLTLSFVLVFSVLSFAMDRTWTGAGAGGSGTVFNTASNWSPSGTPGSADNLTINITSGASVTITLSGSTTVGSLTIYQSRIYYSASVADNFNLNGNTLTINGNLSITNHNAGLYPTNLAVTVPSASLSVGGNLTITNTDSYLTWYGTPISFPQKQTVINNGGTVTITGSTLINSLNEMATSSASLVATGNNATYNFTGAVVLDDGSGEAANSIMLDASSASVAGKFVFKSNLTFGAMAKTNANLAGCTASFEGVSNTTQTITYNNTPAFNLPNVIVGNSNNYPKVILAGSSANTDITGNLTVNGTSTLDLNTRQWNRATTGGAFRMNSTSKLRISGTSSQVNGGSEVIGGSNFPSRFSSNTMELSNNFPTVEYYGSGQTIADVVTAYGDLSFTGTGNIYGSTSSVTFSGNFTKASGVTYVHNNGTLIFNSINNKSMTLPGTMTEFYNFTISGSNPGINNAIAVQKTFTIGTYFNLSNYITLRSTAAGTANVVFANGTSSVGGNNQLFIAERYISSGRKWRFLSINTENQNNRTFRTEWQEGAASPSTDPLPGYGTQITNNSSDWQSKGFDAYSQSGPSVKQWNGSSYTGIAQAYTQIKSAGEAYMVYVRGDRTALASTTNINSTTLRTKGSLYIGDKAISIPATTGYTAVGNPYASAIDLRLLPYTGVAANAFYVWDPKLTGTYGLGAFQTVTKNVTDYTVSPGGGSYGTSGSINNFIQSGAAFFVKGSGTGGTLTFKESSKDNNSAQVMRAQGDALPVVRMNLYIRSGADAELVDGASVIIDNTSSNEVNSDDATKLVNTSENVSIRKSDSLLAVERRKIFTANDTMFLNLTGVRAADYQWKVYMDDLELQNCTPFMADKFTNTLTPLSVSDTNAINFSIQNIPGSYAADRFMIIFKPSAVVPVRFVSVSAVRSNDKSVNVKWNIENEINISSYNVEYSADGRAFTSAGTKAATGANAYSFDHSNASSGIIYYRIKATDADGHIFYSAVVKVNMLTDEAGIAVYPNPVESKRMNIAFVKQAAGAYDVRLINAGGQLVHSSRIQLAGSNETRMLQLGNIASGTYQLVVSSEKSDAITQSVFIK